LKIETTKPQLTSQESVEISENANTPENREEELLAKIRDRFNEIEELIEDMKSKLPTKSK